MGVRGWTEPGGQEKEAGSGRGLLDVEGCGLPEFDVVKLVEGSVVVLLAVYEALPMLIDLSGHPTASVR